MGRHSGLEIPILMILLFILGFGILYSHLPPAVTNAEVGPAVALANQLKPLPVIDDQQCHGVSTAVGDTLTVLQEMNGAMGTGFKAIQFDASNCDIVMQYLPVVGTYNSLILASRSLDPNNQTSVKVFYEDAFLLSSDFIIINDKVAYNVAFKSTGEMDDALGLATLRSVCGDDCYRVVLSGIHWTIRLYMNKFLCDFESWASQYIQIPSPSC